mgnify:CR=1 FL=1
MVIIIQKHWAILTGKGMKSTIFVDLKTGSIEKSFKVQSKQHFYHIYDNKVRYYYVIYFSDS